MNILNFLKSSYYSLKSTLACHTKNTSINDEYVNCLPTDQNALDLFKGEWTSKMPPEHSDLVAGSITVFESPVIDWAEKQLGGFEGANIIELGPLEAGNTYMLEKMGAKSILAIEANSRSFFKCLILKEVLRLKRSHFLLGDFVLYLKEKKEEKFDICLASGVLYHMENPVELIHLCSEISNKIVIWTQYYDKEIIQNNQLMSHRFSTPEVMDYQGFKHTLFKQSYKSDVKYSGFCGGVAPSSNWMLKDDILACLKNYGYNEIHIEFDHPDHPHGPAFAVIGVKSK